MGTQLQSKNTREGPVKEAAPEALLMTEEMAVCRLLALAAAVACVVLPVALATAEAMALAVVTAIAFATACVDTEPLPDEPAEMRHEHC